MKSTAQRLSRGDLLSALQKIRDEHAETKAQLEGARQGFQEMRTHIGSWLGKVFKHLPEEEQANCVKIIKSLGFEVAYTPGEKPPERTLAVVSGGHMTMHSVGSEESK